MKIDWAALGIVAVVAVLATVLFVALLAGGIRLVAASAVVTAGDTAGDTADPRRRRGSAGSRTAGYLLLGLAGLLVIFGIYLILPFAR